MFTCTGCKAVLVLPIPSTVVTAIPSTAHSGSKQPFAEKCLISVKVRILAALFVLNRAVLLSAKVDKKRIRPLFTWLSKNRKFVLLLILRCSQFIAYLNRTTLKYSLALNASFWASLYCTCINSVSTNQCLVDFLFALVFHFDFGKSQ